MNSELKELLALAQRGLANAGVYVSLSLALLGYSRFYRGKGDVMYWVRVSKMRQRKPGSEHRRPFPPTHISMLLGLVDGVARVHARMVRFIMSETTMITAQVLRVLVVHQDHVAALSLSQLRV